MYTFSNKLRTTAIVLMILGLVGITYGFLSTPKTIEDVEKIVAAEHHGGGHETEAAEHKPELKNIPAPADHNEAVATHQEAAQHEAEEEGVHADSTKVNETIAVETDNDTIQKSGDTNCC